MAFRDEKGRLRGADYVIFELPQPVPASVSPTLEKPTLDNPTLEKPMLEKPTLENPTQLNKEIQKTNLPKKEAVTEHAKMYIETLEAITYCEDCHGQYRTIDYGKTCHIP